MNIRQATSAYEHWLRKRMPLLDTDLRAKHQRMAESSFPFLRATFYRWAQLWPRVCPELTGTPRVLGIGDLHVENFGTWRDSEGRLVWGVNDFDEACPVPYANDLVRLAVSAILAIGEKHLSCSSGDACDEILTGYRDGLASGGAPFVLAEQHRGLRDWALSTLRDPAVHWEKFGKLPALRVGVPTEVTAALKLALPQSKLPFRVVHRRSGLGSLGRRRFTALAQWRGGWIAREAKELTVSAWQWEKGSRVSKEIHYQRIIEQAVRVMDPFVRVHGNWLLRRLAPDCSRIELESLPKSRDELRLLRVMGAETANIHLGTKTARRRVLADLKKQPAKWLRKAAEAMAKATVEDWKEWAKSMGK
jgi:hypothetical protein